jgi:hypothetical protein
MMRFCGMRLGLGFDRLKRFGLCRSRRRGLGRRRGGLRLGILSHFRRRICREGIMSLKSRMDGHGHHPDAGLNR